MATYYINADTGNDSTGDGSSALPWLTIAKAVSVAISGDVINLQTATNSYTVSTINFYYDLTINGNNNTIEQISTNDSLSLRAQIIFNDVIFDNLSFTNQYDGLFYFRAASYNAGVTANDCIFKNGSYGLRNGIVFGYEGEFNANFYRCKFHDNAFNNCYLMYVHVGQITSSINNCVFNFESTANIVYFLGRNTGNPSTFTFKNTILVNDQLIQIAFQSGTYSTFELDYDCIYGDFNTASYTATNCITTDPKFIDSVNGDFRLQQDSTCIDAGTII